MLFQLLWYFIITLATKSYDLKTPATKMLSLMYLKRYSGIHQLKKCDKIEPSSLFNFTIIPSYASIDNREKGFWLVIIKLQPFKG